MYFFFKAGNTRFMLNLQQFSLPFFYNGKDLLPQQRRDNIIMIKKNFLLCGSIGWCLEILWTGSHSLFAGETTMMGKTSLLMFPIYGCAAFIGMVYKKISLLPLFIRGCLYAAGIFAAEFSTGSLLKHFDMCPWDYSGTPFHYKGVIRFDYAPLWFFTGLLFEKILAKSS